ncbi:hypothetical protein K449DRAFT_145961 [Hypoxylon sp. EC38]|nr:hypothetical protein K449DRAFT_145961 [Hypoxylon sp. EC38]
MDLAKSDFLEYDGNIRNSPPLCNCRSGFYNLEVFKALLPYQCPLHQNAPFTSRLEAAIRAITTMECCPEVFRLMLEPEWSTNPEAIFRNAGTSMLKGAAVQLSRSVCDRKSTLPNTDSMFTFAVDIIKQTTNIRAAGSEMNFSKEDTVLLPVLYSSLRYSNLEDPLKATPSALRVWLEALEQAGVDLNTYGRREHEIFTNNDSYHYFGLPWIIEYYYSFPVNYYLVDFSYGPEPDDWKLYWSEPTDELAGDFWELIENPPLHIPGSWVD